MEITFTNIDGNWVAEFKARADFNIHLERDAEGRFDIWQKTAGGRYELINETGYLGRRMVYDTDFTALVYPKTIKIISAVNPTVCVVTAVGGDKNITILEPASPDSGVLEYHWEFDNMQDSGALVIGATEYFEEKQGDFSEAYNEIKTLIMEKGTVNYGVHALVGDEALALTNITVNGYRVDSFAILQDEQIELYATNGPISSDEQVTTTAYITTTSLKFYCPTTEKAN